MNERGVARDVWLSPGKPRPEVATRLRELFAAGADDNAIGTALEISPRQAKKVRLALGLLRAIGRATTPNDETIRTLHAGGLSNREIATRSSIKSRTVAERLRKLGLRPNALPRKDQLLPVRWTSADLDRIRGLAKAEGLTVTVYARGRLLGDTECNQRDSSDRPSVSRREVRVTTTRKEHTMDTDTVTKAEAYIDDQDPSDIGWAWRVTYAHGGQDSGLADNLDDAIIQASSCGPEGQVPILVGEWRYHQDTDCYVWSL